MASNTEGSPVAVLYAELLGQAEEARAAYQQVVEALVSYQLVASNLAHLAADAAEQFPEEFDDISEEAVLLSMLRPRF